MHHVNQKVRVRNEKSKVNTVKPEALCIRESQTKSTDGLCGAVITMAYTGHRCLVEPQLPVADQHRILMLQSV